MPNTDESVPGYRPDSTISAPKPTELRSYTPLQVHFVTLLNDLLVKREALANSIDAGDWRLLLIDKTIYSTYQDCRKPRAGGRRETVVFKGEVERRRKLAGKTLFSLFMPNLHLLRVASYSLITRNARLVLAYLRISLPGMPAA